MGLSEIRDTQADLLVSKIHPNDKQVTHRETQANYPRADCGFLSELASRMDF